MLGDELLHLLLHSLPDGPEGLDQGRYGCGRGGQRGDHPGGVQDRGQHCEAGEAASLCRLWGNVVLDT